MKRKNECNSVSFIIPAYNEGANIVKNVHHLNAILEKVEFKYEMIVVNDGSDDDTAELLMSISELYENLVVLSNSVNMGKGEALKKGFFHSKYEIIVFIDGDLDISPSQIMAYIQATDIGDIIIASKRHPRSVVHVPLSRKVLSYGFNICVRLFTGLTLSDTQTGLKAIRRAPLRSVFEKITTNRFAYDVELLAIAKLRGLTVLELPIEISMDSSGFHLIDIIKMFFDLLKISYNLNFSNYYLTNS